MFVKSKAKFCLSRDYYTVGEKIIVSVLFPFSYRYFNFAIAKVVALNLFYFVTFNNQLKAFILNKKYILQLNQI